MARRPSKRQGDLKLLDWDSRFFSKRIARVMRLGSSSKKVRLLLERAHHARLDLLYLLIDAADTRSIRLAAAAGFDLIDLRITLTCSLDNRPVEAAASNTTLRLARSADRPALGRMASQLHGKSRFAVDPRFPKDAHRRLFREWIRKSVHGKFDDYVWVAYQGRHLAGYISCRRAPGNIGVIGLLGVAPSFAGRNIGTALVARALEHFYRQKIRTVSVVTQGSNIVAQRLYQRCGFRTSGVDLWYHRWLS